MFPHGLRALYALAMLAPPLAAAQDAASFRKRVEPFLQKHCLFCHSAKVKTAGLDLDAHRDPALALTADYVWEEVLEKLRSGQMPPPGRPRPAAGELKAVTAWVERFLARPGREQKTDPGRVTARRLNRVEYNNTIRDLLEVEFRPADDFPVDDAGYGFDNIGDVLSLSPVLMEKYLAAAETVARMAIGAGPLAKPVLERYEAERIAGKSSGSLRVRHRFPAQAEYEIRAGAGGRRLEVPPRKLAVWLDGRQIGVFELESGQNKRRSFEVRLTVKPGDRQVRAALLDRPPGLIDREKDLVVDFVEVRGPFPPQPPESLESHRRIFMCGHAAGQHAPGCARVILGNLARRAWRRPPTEQELAKLEAFVAQAQQEGDSFEQGIQVAVQAILVSPHFLFRIERDPDPTNPAAVHAINEYEFATRLSYFLWSSIPDDELRHLAGLGVLRRPEILKAQVRRMLADPKSDALVENFGGQWLQLRNLESVKPDPERFPEFDEDLRDAMYGESRALFEAILREDRSVLEFLHARYSFVNERLARHYGIEGVRGEQFQRVALNGQRRGVLAHASILTISSYPTRTSPVLRGKWVLENFLGAPPPPPPPDVPELDEKKIGLTGTLRQQLEQHRTSPACSVCHVKMDAIGFGLENFDPIGRWRTLDGKFPVDSSGTLPGGRSFKGPAELIEALNAEQDDFVRCLTEKLLTYGLGRGLEFYDKPAVELISRRLGESGYRFSSLIWEIVNSAPFQMRRGEKPKS